MRTLEQTISLAILSIIFFSISSETLAQSSKLPGELMKDSSLEEVINRLDKTSFAKARIGFHKHGQELSENEIPTANTTYSEEAVFSQGFRLAKVEGCRIALKNDDVKLIDFSTKYPDPQRGSLSDFREQMNNQIKYTGFLNIALDSLNENKRKKTFRHTKKIEKAKLLGTWQTKYYLKNYSLFSLIFNPKEKIKTYGNDLNISITLPGNDDGYDRMTGDFLTFTFDDKQTSEKFDSAFHRAIKLCNEK